MWQILHDAGSASRRTGLTWNQFLTAQARGILSVDFARVDTVFLRRLYTVIVIEHGTRCVDLVGITTNLDGIWTTQAACNGLMDLGQRATSVKFLVRDRAGQFTSSFDAVFTAEGVRILVNEHHLRQVLTEYLRHYNPARHRSLSRRTPAQADSRRPEPINLAEYGSAGSRSSADSPTSTPCRLTAHAAQR